MTWTIEVYNSEADTWFRSGKRFVSPPGAQEYGRRVQAIATVPWRVVRVGRTLCITGDDTEEELAGRDDMERGR